MTRHFDWENCMQEFWFDRKLIEVIIGEVFFSLDDDNVSDSDSDVDGEGDTKAPPTSRKEQALRFFDIEMMETMWRLSRILRCTS